MNEIDRQISNCVLVFAVVIAIAVGVIVWSGVEKKDRENGVDAMVSPEGKLLYY